MTFANKMAGQLRKRITAIRKGDFYPAKAAATARVALAEIPAEGLTSLVSRLRLDVETGAANMERLAKRAEEAYASALSVLEASPAVGRTGKTRADLAELQATETVLMTLHENTDLKTAMSAAPFLSWWTEYLKDSYRLMLQSQQGGGEEA